MTENANEVIPLPPPADELESMLVEQPTTGALQRLEAEARSMHTAYQIASSLSKTAMVPEQYQQSKNGETAAYNLCAAIMYGAELGLSAVQSAQNIFIVKGKPAIYSNTMAAVIRRAGFVMEEVEASDNKVVWKALRDDTWAFSEWTKERAEKAGYTSNRLYETNTTAMLRAKCIAELARIKFQDCITGMAHSIEELQLDNVIVQRVVKQGPRGTAALREIAAQAEAGEPEPVAESTESQDESNEEPAAPTNEQVDKIRKLYRAQGVTGQAVLDDITLFLQAEERVTNLHNLSAEDAQAVIDRLAPPKEEG